MLSYNDSSQMLTETLTDLVTGATYSTSYTENLQSILGSNTAYVGFSAGNGGGQSTQIVSNFTLADPTLAVPSPAATTDANTPVTLSGVTVSDSIRATASPPRSALPTARHWSAPKPASPSRASAPIH